MKRLRAKGAIAVILLCGLAPAPLGAQQSLMPGVSRDVTPQGVTPGPKITAPLKRIPGVAPPPPDIRERNLYRIKVVDTATFEGRYLGRIWRVELPGVVGISRDVTCTAQSANWPCGAFVVRALQRHIRLSALNCAFAWQPQDQPLQISCALRGADLRDIVVSKGWAYAADEAPERVQNLADEAYAQSAGMYQPPPRGWKDYQALTRQGSSADLPPPPDLPVADILGPIKSPGNPGRIESQE
uniref:hypothetical protein n=1 Tax=Pararhizobium sp. IMCC3301 TaxID=3067904 RepID=UPI00274276E5|nr:hypothetical protein [Pararhizobium sp. IMCC3301]